jgi:riboflavin kinase/FMN adenylyltransferase
MKVINDGREISKPFKSAVVTIGNFDGVHVGHQALIRQTIANARRLEGTSVVMTFEPHPRRVLNHKNQFPLITSYEQKEELIKTTGVDVIICMPFTRDVAATSARTFVKEVLCETIGMKAMIEGPDYSFGNKREGSIVLLKEMGRSCGFEVIVSEWVRLGAQRVSSTEVRRLVREGRVGGAAKLLGRHYQVRGTVVHGKEQGGRLLGFPTANLKLDNELFPKSGVYAVTVECNRMVYEGVTNVGYCPTFDNGEFSVEVHILDFDQDIYGCPMRVNFVRRLREERRYPRPEPLVKQIRQDVQEVRSVLSDHGQCIG